MAALRTAFLIALATVVAAPSAAQASTLQPLRDVAPLGSKFKDRVTTSSTRVAHAALSLNWSDYKTKEGGAVAAAVSDRYGPTFDRTIVQSYVDFLDGLDHGSELTSLKIYIAPPAEVTAQCGGADGTLACYDSGTKIMVVPGEQTDTGTSGVTTSYVVAHEYGHH
ncbi:MAG: hypothetical protein QOJ29_1639, partial [Thermoleophilaceae bacterium]|nr:hypothetical protein [Thermoleophilaceae bacterium]